MRAGATAGRPLARPPAGAEGGLSPPPCDAGIQPRRVRLRSPGEPPSLPRSLRARLYLLVGIASLAFVAVGLHAVSFAWRARREAELTASLELSRTAAAALRGYVAEVLHDAGTLGRAVAGEPRPGDAQNRLLAEAAADLPSVREFTWAGPDGRIAASSNPSAVGGSVARTDFFRSVAGGEERVVSDLLPGGDGRGAVVIARGIRRPDGALAGVVIAVVAPERLGARAVPVVRQGKGTLTILDRRGQVVFRLPPLDPDAAPPRLATDQPVLAAALAGREASGALRLEAGEEALGAMTPVEGVGWVAGASRSTEEALGPLRREILVLLGTGILVALLALVASGLMGTRFVAALRKLERHAAALGRGARPRRPLRGPDEITRLARAYEEMAAGLLAAQHRFRAVVEEAPAGVLVLEPDGLRVRLVNRAFLDFLEEPFRSAGVEGLPLAAFFPGADELGLLDRLRQAAAEGVPSDEPERRSDRFARGPTWWRWSVRPIPAEGGGRELLLVVSDVTDPVRAREQVDLERRRLECVLRTLPVGVLIADAGGQLVHANDEARRIWGSPALPRPGQVGEPRARWAGSGAPLDPLEWPHRRALRDGEPVGAELIALERGEGRQAILQTQAAPIRDGEGRVTGAVSTLLDVSRLHEAVRDRDHLLEVVSQDLRGPLATVALGASSLARLEDGPVAAARARRTGARIAHAGRRMARLIEDLLDLASLDEGRLALRRAPCDPAELLACAAEELRPAAADRGLDLCLSACPGLPRVSADRERILHALAGLAASALRATERGAICLAAEPCGEAVAFRVRDAGPGVPAEELTAIFDRRCPAGPGWGESGLGLAVARGLVEAHGGAIWADSAPGEGTTVSFTLPVAAADAEAVGADSGDGRGAEPAAAAAG